MDTRNIRLVRLELGQYNAVIRITDITRVIDMNTSIKFIRVTHLLCACMQYIPVRYVKKKNLNESSAKNSWLPLLC